MKAILNFKGGNSIVASPPIFSSDGENIFVCGRTSIYSYSTKTGKLIQEFKGLSKRIVGFAHQNFTSYSCIIACSQFGEVIVWKSNTAYKILQFQLAVKKIKTFHFIPSESETDLKGVISYRISNNILFSVVDLKNNSYKQTNLSFKADKSPHFVNVSKIKYFSVVHGKTIYFVRFDDLNYVSSDSLKSRFFTCVSCHSTEEVVLTGDNTGQVIVWQNIFSQNKTQAIFHWHTLPVRSVCFSAAGSFFYSGGDECVLVKWQFEDANNKKFLPRIAAEIAHISMSSNNMFVAVATRDNAVRITDSQLNEVTLIQHLVLGKQYDSGIIYDPRTRALVMNGNCGQVQFYSPSDMSLLYNVDIVGQNKITNERDCKIQNTEITKVSISKSGLWLATVEERHDEEYHREIRLKFWRFDSKTQLFELNTSIEYPHEKSINIMQFQPVSTDERLHCVTVGNDQKFKIWQLGEVTSVYRKGLIWKSYGIGFYKDFDCSSLSFSVDGSLIAVGFNSVLTTWTPDTCEMKCSLTHPIHCEVIKQVQFGYSNQCHLVVSVSAHQLSVWNLLNLCMMWTVPVQISMLVADPLSTHMAVITTNNTVFVFSPISSTLIYSNKRLLKEQGKIVAGAFVPSKYSNDARLNWYERSQLYFINSKNELYCITSENVDNFEDEIDVEDEYKSAFSRMIPNSKTSLAQQSTPIKHLFEKDIRHKTFRDYLDAPVQTMPPVRLVCFSLLESLVVQKETVS